MASTIIDPIADRLKAVLDALQVTGYWPPVAMPDTMPAAMIQPPAVRRVDPDSGESQMGSNDWQLTFGVSVYFDLTDTATAQATGVDFMEAFIQAVDDDRSLAGLVLDASVTNGEPDYSRIAETRPVFIYDCTVETLVLVAQ